MADGSIGVRVRPTDLGTRANFVSVCTCGSGTACPTCADKIMPRRAGEILAVVDAHHQARGQVMAATYTLAHTRADRLADLWWVLNKAWGAASGGRKTTKRAMGAHVVGWIRNVEATWSYRYGWHLHIHALWLLEEDTTPEDADRIAAASFNDWRDKAIDLGANPPDPQAFHCKVLTLGETVEQVAGYLAKTTYETAAWELAGGPRKKPAPGRYTPFMLLERVIDRVDDRDGELDECSALALQLWREWEQAARGKRIISYSQNLRSRYGLQAERSDQELADDDRDEGRVLEQTLSREMWAQIRYTTAWRLLGYLEAGTVEEADERLSAWIDNAFTAGREPARPGAADFPRSRAP